MQQYKILSGVEAPSAVIKQLENLLLTDRIVKNFVICAVTQRGKTQAEEPVYQLGFVDNEGTLIGYGGCRQSIETQLLRFGFISPNLSTQQSLAWRCLKSTIEKAGDFRIDENILRGDCFEYSILGYLDELAESYSLSDSEYLACRSQLKSLNYNPFAADIQWYFGCSVPEDTYRSSDDIK